MDKIAQQKDDARKAASKHRDEIHSRLAETARQSLAENALGFLELKPETIVSGFLPFRSEIDITGLMASLTANKVTTALPVVIAKAQPLQFRAWQPGEPLEPGAFGIDAPPNSAAVTRPDILLVPLLAFDKDGYRLGYGGGFYDRTIETLRKTGKVTSIGVAFAEQQVDHVTRGTYDEPVDWILTEQGPLKCV